RINGLRAVLESHLNSPDFPTSPLRVDREGFNREHEFSRALLEFLAGELRPCYERERKRLEEREQGKFSDETRKRIEDALKHLNRFFQEITEKTGSGEGGEDPNPKEPKEGVLFFPLSTKLIVNKPRKVLLLVREDLVDQKSEVVATASEGISVQPEVASLSAQESLRWAPHKNFFCLPFTLVSSSLGARGTFTSLLECTGGQT